MIFRNILLILGPLLVLHYGLFDYAYAGVPKSEDINSQHNFTPSVSRSDNALPTDPLLDRAKGYLLQGKLKSAITNYGSVVDGFSHHPGGLWGEYSYFPSISFMYSIPGHKYSHMYDWEMIGNAGGYPIWKSIDAGQNWELLPSTSQFEYVTDIEIKIEENK